MNVNTALSGFPEELRNPLIEEYRQIIQNYSEHRWSPAELSGGRFCEVVYSILEGVGSGTFAAKPSKPSDFVTACRKLETYKSSPRSFQVLIPRMLPALYEVRNNRGVGHVGGDVDPNHMDATVVVSMCNWIMAELVRVQHSLSIDEAQSLVDALAERTIPIIWQNGNVKRLLDPSFSVRDQILVLLASAPTPVDPETLREWTTYKNKSYFNKLVKDLDTQRCIYVGPDGKVEILPPGTSLVSEILAARTKRT